MVLEAMFIHRAPSTAEAGVAGTGLLPVRSKIGIFLIGKIVTSVAYKPEVNKIEITHLGTTFLKPKTDLLDP